MQTITPRPLRCNSFDSPVGPGSVARQASGEVVTGLLYVDPEATDLHGALRTSSTPLNKLAEAALCPGAAALAKINASFR